MDQFHFLHVPSSCSLIQLIFNRWEYKMEYDIEMYDIAISNMI